VDAIEKGERRLAEATRSKQLLLGILAGEGNHRWRASVAVIMQKS
jgi:hypothetical protein